ncbi:TPA: Lar family restriction alleviation protein [Pseudomonas aeruginosa]|uniref:Lar family restriction alleviation protein n=1 Tax=Pseudomonas aeruginosa TaxID=287 RepID=UPI0014828C05|nr:Lar family restriction alleviation protein [Pseudomonas aeruginosa]HEJ3875326.1 Lar family restriction alleviation protein [Pseudomonas aeruginosa]HEJ5077395.1 Lar family restriction alleviation protein [Pseudomonas aeruginosa]HEJ9715284.1 Lar family restriction alleviation protein [Pseudomonas aeruginosa]HEK3651051.1 Lar family restriction alleviation protein [Pseudomonas aeruginosa]
MSELKPCPCCGGEAGFVELEDGGMVAVCASKGCVASGVARYACGDEPRPLIAETWNTRAIPAGHMVVSEGLLRRLLDSDGIDGIFDAQQNYAAHQELRALLSEQEGGKP